MATAARGRCKDMNSSHLERHGSAKAPNNRQGGKIGAAHKMIEMLPNFSQIAFRVLRGGSPRASRRARRLAGRSAPGCPSRAYCMNENQMPGLPLGAQGNFTLPERCVQNCQRKASRHNKGPARKAKIRAAVLAAHNSDFRTSCHAHLKYIYYMHV